MDDCFSCEFAKRSKYGVFKHMCNGSCVYVEYAGEIGKKISPHELCELNFGAIIRVDYYVGEYQGVIFGKNIGHEDGKIDSINTTIRDMNRDLCSVYLLSD